MNENIQNLIRQFQNLPSIQSEARAKIQSQIEDELGKAVRQSLQQNKGQVSQELISMIDPLYDISGMPTRLAMAMGIEFHELRELLSRQREVQCSRCGDNFLVKELRRMGGYTRKHTKLCKKCTQEESQDWQDQQTREAARAIWQAQTDGRILARSTRDALAIQGVKETLEAFIVDWLGGTTTQWGQVTTTHGCQLCDQSPLTLWLTKEDHVTDKLEGLVEFWDYHFNGGPPSRYDHDPQYTVLERPLQLLFRISPHLYFEGVREMPLLHQPLLFLCEKHSFVAAETHFQPLDKKYSRGK